MPPALAGSTDYAALKKAGVPLLGYGEFITQAVNFVIIAFIIFLMVRAVNRLMPKRRGSRRGRSGRRRAAARDPRRIARERG